MGSRTRLGGGWETCLIAGGVPFYSPAALDSVCQKRNSIVYSPAARNSVNSVMEVNNKESEIKTKPCAFQIGYGASFRRVTPSTQVRRLSGSHSDTGFQLTQLPRWEKWRWNSMAKSPRNCRCFNKGCFPLTANLSGGKTSAQLSSKKQVWGWKRGRNMNQKKRRVESQLEIVQQVHIHGQRMLPSLMHSFVGQSSIRELCPPASS